MNEEAMTPDKEQVVEPLSAAEEIALRRGIARIMESYVPTGEDKTIARLLSTLDAARTARVAGLDRERLAGDIIEKHIIRVARYFWPDGSHIETFAREALAALNSAASIEQEPGEDDLLAKVRQAVAAIPQSLRHEDVPRKGGWSVGFLDAMTRVLATIDAMGESR